MYDNDKFTPQAAKRKRKKSLLDQISLFSGFQMPPAEEWNDEYDPERQHGGTLARGRPAMSHAPSSGRSPLLMGFTLVGHLHDRTCVCSAGQRW